MRQIEVNGAPQCKLCAFYDAQGGTCLKHAAAVEPERYACLDFAEALNPQQEGGASR